MCKRLLTSVTRLKLKRLQASAANTAASDTAAGKIVAVKWLQDHRQEDI